MQIEGTQLAHPNAMTGPEFLDAVADQHAANSNDINADAFRMHATRWQRDLQLLAQALAEIDNYKARLLHIADQASTAGNSIGTTRPVSPT